MARRKVNDSENLTDTNMAKVIALLRAEKPITKKAACEMLCISYNTTRLDKLISEYEEKKAYHKKMYDSKKGKAPEIGEIVYIIQEYLNGENISNISKSLFRTPESIEKVLKANAVPIQKAENDYHKPVIIPDEGVKENFTIGEICYAARYKSLATIEKVVQQTKDGPVYRVWLTGEAQKQYALQPWWELMSLSHLSDKYGVKF